MVEIKLALLMAKLSKFESSMSFNACVHASIKLSIQFPAVKECGCRTVIFTTRLFGYLWQKKNIARKLKNSSFLPWKIKSLHSIFSALRHVKPAISGFPRHPVHLSFLCSREVTHNPTGKNRTGHCCTGHPSCTVVNNQLDFSKW